MVFIAANKVTKTVSTVFTNFWDCSQFKTDQTLRRLNRTNFTIPKMNIPNPSSEIIEKMITSRHILTPKKTRFQLAKWYANIAPNTKRIAPIIIITKRIQGLMILSFFLHSAWRITSTLAMRLAPYALQIRIFKGIHLLQIWLMLE